MLQMIFHRCIGSRFVDSSCKSLIELILFALEADTCDTRFVSERRGALSPSRQMSLWLKNDMHMRGDSSVRSSVSHMAMGDVM